MKSKPQKQKNSSVANTPDLVELTAKDLEVIAGGQAATGSYQGGDRVGGDWIVNHNQTMISNSLYTEQDD